MIIFNDLATAVSMKKWVGIYIPECRYNVKFLVAVPERENFDDPVDSSMFEEVDGFYGSSPAFWKSALKIM
jgi:hypothetical protein